MTKNTAGPVFAALLVFSMTACTSSHKAEADATATTSVTTVADAANVPAADPSTAAAAEDASKSDDEKPGAGHVSITGDYRLEEDFVVDMCQVSSPGDGLLSGYHMGAKDGDPKLQLLSIALKNYEKDGSYDDPSQSQEGAVGQAMSSGVGPLTLMVLSPGNPVPTAFMQMPSSKLTIAVSDGGAKGTAAFADFESQRDMSAFDPKSGKLPAGKRASGTIAWTCGTVGRINGKMNDAVNGAFRQLIPGH